MSEEDIIRYYINQAGSGIGSIYSAPLYQKGYGIGSFLGGLFRAVIPFFKSRGMSVGKQLLKAGVDVLGDMQENQTIKDSLRKRKADILSNVKEAVISGKGYLKRRKLNIPQLPPVSRRSKTKKRELKIRRNLQKKIFSETKKWPSLINTLLYL
jgi:hypothetical protein